MNAALSLATVLVSVVFAALVLVQWRQRRRAFQFVWGIGLVWYAISSGAQFAGAALGWNSELYRLWYLFGAILVAAYLGMGTVYLLSRTGFAHFAGVAIAVGGLFAPLTQLALIREGHPTANADVVLVVVLSGATGFLIIAATAISRRFGAHVAMAVLLAATLVIGGLTLTAALPAPGWAVDPVTQVPVGRAVPGYLRILTGPFNVAGALCLIAGAVFSVYVYMPKRKVLHGAVHVPVLGQLHRVLAVVVNLVASLPVAVRALVAGRLNSRVPATALIAAGGFVPSVTGGFEHFGITWGFALGELLGVLLIFAGFLVSEEVLRRRPASVAAAIPGAWAGSGRD